MEGEHYGHRQWTKQKENLAFQKVTGKTRDTNNLAVSTVIKRPNCFFQLGEI